jgi:hypothetical protein
MLAEAGTNPLKRTNNPRSEWTVADITRYACFPDLLQMRFLQTDWVDRAGSGQPPILKSARFWFVLYEQAVTRL